jgi:hypothetical protein
MWISEDTMSISMQVPQNTKNRTIYNSAVPLLGIYPKKCKAAYKKLHICMCMSQFKIAKLQNQSRYPLKLIYWEMNTVLYTVRNKTWTIKKKKKMYYGYIMEYYYSVIKKNKIISLQENISITGDHYVKKNEPNWERQILHVLCHVPNLDLRKTMCVKLGLLGMRTSERGTVKGEGEGGWIWSKYFVYICENRIIKSTGNCLKSERGG